MKDLQSKHDDMLAQQSLIESSHSTVVEQLHNLTDMRSQIMNIQKQTLNEHCESIDWNLSTLIDENDLLSKMTTESKAVNDENECSDFVHVSEICSRIFDELKGYFSVDDVAPPTHDDDDENDNVIETACNKLCNNNNNVELSIQKLQQCISRCKFDGIYERCNKSRYVRV